MSILDIGTICCSGSRFCSETEPLKSIVAITRGSDFLAVFVAAFVGGKGVVDECGDAREANLFGGGIFHLLCKLGWGSVGCDRMSY